MRKSLQVCLTILPITVSSIYILYLVNWRVLPEVFFTIFLFVTIWSLGLLLAYRIYRALGLLAFLKMHRPLWDNLRFTLFGDKPNSLFYPGRDGQKPSVQLRQNPDRRQLRRLYEDLEIAVYPEGGAIVYPYMLLWRGYRLDPAQLDRFRRWRATELDVRRRENPAMRWLYGSTIIIAVLCYGFFISRQVRSSAFLGGVLLFAIAATLYTRHRQKRAFRRAFPDVTARMRDPNRTRKRILLLMFTPLFGHISTSVLAPLLTWITVAGFVYMWNAIRSSDLAAWNSLTVVMTLVAFPALTGFVGFLAIKHIAFRIRHGRGPSTDDFYAL